MSPRQLLSREVQRRLAPRLMSAGFQFSPGRLEFRRTRCEFIDTVRLNIAKGCEPDTCQFTSAWVVESPCFAVQHERAWGYAPDDTIICVIQDWLLCGWPRSSLGFRLLDDEKRCEAEMREFYEGASLVGIPFLERVDS